MLDARNRPVAVECISKGTLTTCLVHPREVFRPAIRCSAAQVIAVHNHPSGDPTPSSDDRKITERLAEAGDLLGIPLVDHVVVARGGYRSIGSRG
jgi:DNA repair protein RadC